MVKERPHSCSSQISKKKNMSKDIRTQLHAELAERTRHLQTISEALKTELFGIDDIIDRVIDSLRAWYVLPQLISRPVIVCLWGLTGTGKTQLVRKLAQHLGFYDRFIEVQMDGFSHGSGYHSRGSISAMLAESGIAESTPGILVLDEFQRFRTVDGNGNEAKVERYQDVWALLSDGRLPPALSMLGEIESSLAQAEYVQDRDGPADRKKDDKKRKLHLSPWEAREVKRCRSWPGSPPRCMRACAPSATRSKTGRPTTASCWCSSRAISTRCTPRRPAASRTATPTPTSSTH
jgi:cell division protease FtsH